MKLYCKNKTELVQYAKDQLRAFPDDLQLTMTITPLKSGGFSALTVITDGSVDTVKNTSQS